MDSDLLQMVTSAVDAGAWVVVLYLLLSDRRKLAEMTAAFIEHLEQESALRRLENAVRTEKADKP